MKALIMSILSMVILLACSKINDDSKLNISISNIKNLSDSYKVSHIITLETNKNCLIGTTNKILRTDSLVVILDTEINNKVLTFDMEGNYLYSIDKKGKGAGEFLNIGDISVNIKKNELYVLDSSQRKIIIFNLHNGLCIREVKLKQHFRNLGYCNNEFYLFSTTSDQILHVYDLSGKIKGKYIHNMLKDKSMSYNTSIYNDEDKILFATPFDNSIYKIEEGTVTNWKKIQTTNWIPQELLKYHSKDLRKELLIKDKTGEIIYSITIQDKTENFLYTCINFRRYDYFLETDLRSLKTIYYTTTTNCDPFSGKIIGMLDGQIIMFCETRGIAKRYEKIKNRPNVNMTSKIESIINNLDAQDNPILVFYEKK